MILTMNHRFQALILMWGEIEGDETSDSNTFTNSNGYKDDSSILLSHEILNIKVES